MSTIHAWFSQAAALIHGSAVYRKESGSTVNVTRMSDENEVAGFFRYTENMPAGSSAKKTADASGQLQWLTGSPVRSCAPAI